MPLLCGVPLVIALPCLCSAVLCHALLGLCCAPQCRAQQRLCSTLQSGTVPLLCQARQCRASATLYLAVPLPCHASHGDAKLPLGHLIGEPAPTSSLAIMVGAMTFATQRTQIRERMGLFHRIELVNWSYMVYIPSPATFLSTTILARESIPFTCFLALCLPKLTPSFVVKATFPGRGVFTHKILGAPSPVAFVGAKGTIPRSLS